MCSGDDSPGWWLLFRQDADTEGEEGPVTSGLRPRSPPPSAMTKQSCSAGSSASPHREFREEEHPPSPPVAGNLCYTEGIIPALLLADLERWRQKLLGIRQRRVRPFRTKKCSPPGTAS